MLNTEENYVRKRMMQKENRIRQNADKAVKFHDS